MQGRSMIVAAALAVSVMTHADSDPFAGWTPQQLKVKVQQLQAENKILREKLAAAPVAATAPAIATSAPAKADMLLDDFEADMAKNGMTWWNGNDEHKLGTVLQPNPYAATKGGSPASPGRSNRISGKMGANHEPWPWASTALAQSNEDLRGYSAISFYAKGDGKQHKVSLCKREVKDFCHYTGMFTAPKEWTKVTIKFSDLAQANWGAAVPKVFNDVEKIEFAPGTPEASFDFSIDDLTLVK